MRKEWSQKEERYVERYYLKQPMSVTAKYLGRSVSSVQHKALKMGLNHYASGINAKTLAKCFSVDVSVVLRWIKKFDLPCRKVVCSNQTRYVIDEIAFWKWAKNNQSIINWKKYQRNSILPEPDWVAKAIKEYEYPNSRKKYTEFELNQIKCMLRKGFSYANIAMELGRSCEAIKHIGRTIYQ